MTNIPPHAHTEFHPNDNVRLLQSHGDVRSGTLGRILGRFARDASPTYVVSFEGDRPRVAGDVRFEEIVLVDDLRGSAG
ncbi:MAG: hypothetical protein QOF45_2029 [Gaiellaceae bacterium]|jgi:hypothetical protein|nr:hypothetical protein [Gaiellaceae bacterium]